MKVTGVLPNVNMTRNYQCFDVDLPNDKEGHLDLWHKGYRFDVGVTELWEHELDTGDISVHAPGRIKAYDEHHLAANHKRKLKMC